MRCHITLLVIFGFLCGLGCESSVEPAKVVIHYLPFYCPYVDGIRINSCDMVVRCNERLAMEWDPTGTTTVCDSVVIKDAKTVARLWSMSGDTASFKKAGDHLNDVRACVVFSDRQGQVMRTIALSFYPEMEIDGRLYRRDVRLFNAVMDQLPDNYLRKPTSGFWSWGVDGDYFYDAGTHWYKNAKGEYMDAGGASVVLRSKITGNPADTGYYYRLPERIITGDSTDTGYHYIDIELYLYGGLRDTVFRR